MAYTDDSEFIEFVDVWKDIDKKYDSVTGRDIDYCTLEDEDLEEE